MRRSIWVSLAFLACSHVCAQNVTRLYDRAKLEADAKRFSEQLRAEFRETMLPQLTEAERAALREVKIEVPLAGRKGDPFDFYSDSRTVYLPALSLRFFADLAVANAWLNAHGFDGTTVRDYVGYLSNQARISATFPLPPVFRALGVPENAREETAVANRADRNFANTVFFLLGHELGHVRHRHHEAGQRTEAQRRIQEMEADAFAIELLRRIGQVPLGLEFWFDLERIRHPAPARIPAEAEWQKELAAREHPVTTERLNALAAELEKAPEDFAKNQTNVALWTTRAKMFAQYFRMAAPFAGNSVARVVEYERIRKEVRLASLKPRKAGFAAPTGDGAEEDFQGLFRVRRSGAAGDEVDLLLLRNGEEVTGAYSNAKVQGTLTGEISEGVLRAEWKEGTAGGQMLLRTSGAELNGTWGVGAEDKDGGTWEGARVQRE